VSPLLLAGLLALGGLSVWGLAVAIVGPGSSSDGAPPESSASASPGSDREFPNEWPEAPPADVGALLGGLGPGSALDGGWRVRGISPPKERRVVIDVQRDGIGFRVWLTAKGAGPPGPPKQTERYALYTVQPRPEQNSVPNEEFGRVLEALGSRVAQNEARVPTPRGL
jgi:hypothetical protein